MENFFRESGVKWLWEKIKTLLSAKQDKLVSGTNIKTINGTSLLGSGDVSISGDASGSVDEGRLVWSDEDSPSTLIDIAYLNGNGNKIAGIPPSLVTIEYSADNGATWVDSGISDANKTRLTNHRINGNTFLRPNGSTTLDINYQTRITIDLIEDNATNAWVGCFEFRKIILKCSGVQKNDTHTLTIEMQKYGSTTWDIIKTSRFWGSPGFFSIPTPKRTVGYPSFSYYRKVRLTWQTGDVYTNVASINGVYFMSDNIVGVGGGKEPSQYAITGTPYSIDYNLNTTFPNAIKGKKLITDGGTSTQVVKGNGSLEEESALAVASAIDAEHAIEADYAGVADKADKLTTARTIVLNGGVTSTATTFDGSKNVNVPVTALNDTHLVYKKLTDVNTEAPYLTPIDGVSGQFTANRLAFKKPENILIEYSNDNGASWNTSTHTDETKVSLVSGIGTYLYLGNKTTGQTNQDKLRITILAGENKDFYSTWQRLYIYLATNGAYAKGDHGLWCTYEYSLNKTPDVWVSKGEWFMTGWSGWNKLPALVSTFGDNNNLNHPHAIRLTFRFEGHASGYENTTKAIIRKIELRGDTAYGNHTGCKLAETGHMYSYDWQKNVTFPAAIIATKYVTSGGTNQQVLLGDGSLRPISELSPITDADAEILLDNHIHGIDVSVSGDDVNINVIESSKNGNAWETTEKSLPVPVATQETAGVISAADKQKIDAINYEDNTLFVGDGTNGMLSIGYDSSKASADMRVFRDRYSTIHVTSYNDTTGGSIAVMESNGGKGRMEVNGDQFAELVLSGAGQVRATLTKENEDGTNIKTIIDAAEGITAPKLATIGGTSEQILLGDGTLITFDELKAKLGLI